MAPKFGKSAEKLKIIVVDDSDFSRRQVVDILESEGFEVTGQAASAEEALKLMKDAQVNLFIIDVVMPDVSGLELAKVLNEQSSFNKLYMIMMSSLHMENVLIESISNGAVDFLYKPFEKDELIKAVKKVEQYLAE